MKAIHVSSAHRATFKRLCLGLAVGAAVLSTVGPRAQAATISYTFAGTGAGNNTANLEGWTLLHSAGWAKYDWWGSDGNIGDGWSPAESQLAQSPSFNLDGSGDLSWQIIGVPASPASAPPLHSADIGPLAIVGAGFMGMALRDVATDTYVLSMPIAGTNFEALGAVWPSQSFTQAELLPYANDGKAYTLDFIDNNKSPNGEDHWATLGGASIPGVAAIPEPTSLSLLALGALGLLRRNRR